MPMRLEERYTPVYRDRPGPFGGAIVRFIVQHKTDCVICLEFQTDPQVLECGHVLCASCLELTRLHFKVCPVCFSPIVHSYGVRWVFLEDVAANATISLELVRFRAGDNVANYRRNPFSLFYYENGEETEKTGVVFYQESNGAPYYLSPALTAVLRKRRRIPERIHTRVLRVTSQVIRPREATLPHLPLGRRVFYVDVRL